MVFVLTVSGGAINLDHVAHVRETRRGTSDLIGVDGAILGTTYSRAESIRDLSLPVVPASPGDWVYMVTIYDDFISDDLPDESLLDIRKVPVRAWRIDDGMAAPIFNEDVVTDQTYWLPGLSGEVIDPFNCIYPNFDAAKAELLETVQKNWRQKQAKKSVTNAE